MSISSTPPPLLFVLPGWLLLSVVFLHRDMTSLLSRPRLLLHSILPGFLSAAAAAAGTHVKLGLETIICFLINLHGKLLEGPLLGLCD